MCYIQDHVINSNNAYVIILIHICVLPATTIYYREDVFETGQLAVDTIEVEYIIAP